MPQLIIHKYPGTESSLRALLEQMETIRDSIRRQGFNLFENGGADNSCDVRDWLRARRGDAVFATSDLVEARKTFVASIPVSGFEAKDIILSVEPGALLVQARSHHSRALGKGKVCFCEFEHTSLFRRLELPTPIDVNRVTASIENGILKVIAPKASASQKARSAGA
jgi:HSP20 family molecular chaperone IbpA